MFKVFAQILRKYKFLYNWLWLDIITLNKINSTNKKKMQYFIIDKKNSNDIKFHLKL